MLFQNYNYNTLVKIMHYFYSMHSAKFYKGANKFNE